MSPSSFQLVFKHKRCPMMCSACVCKDIVPPSFSPASFLQRCRQPGRSLCPCFSIFSLDYQSTPSIWSQQSCLQNETAKHFTKRLAPAAHCASTAEIPIVLRLCFQTPLLF